MSEVAKAVSGKVASFLANRMLSAVFAYVQPDVISMYIDNDWSIVEAILMALNEDDGYISKASPDGYGELAVHMRRALIWVVDAVLGIVDVLVNKYGVEVLDKYLNVNYVVEYLRRNRPELLSVIEEHGDKGIKWLERQLRELKLFFLGKAAWDSERKRAVFLD